MAEAGTCLREIEVEVPADTVEKETQKVVRQVARVARIPGFRPGKAPAEIVRRRFWDDIRGEVLQNLLPDSLSSALKEQNFNPVDRPAITHLEFEAGKPLRYKASFEVLPEFELRQYKGLVAPRGKIERTEDHVKYEIDRLREQHATFEPVTDRGAEDGDTVVTALAGTFLQPEDAVGRQPLNLENAEVLIGSENTLSGFSDALKGTRPDDARQFEVEYPEDFPEKNLAGCTVAFSARVTAVRRKQLPDCNDDFARQVGDYTTFAQLEKAVKKQIEQSHQEMEKQVTRQNVLDALLAAHDFPVPEALVEQQTNARVERRLRALLSQGIDPRTVQINWEKLRAEQREGAEREVRLGLLTDRIAAAEAIEATEEEVGAEIARLAAQTSQSPEALRARLTKDEGLDRIKNAVRSDKVVDFLVSHAQLTTKGAD